MMSVMSVMLVKPSRPRSIENGALQLTFTLGAGDRGDLLQPRVGESSLRDRDVRDGRQYAGENGRVQWNQKARREGL